MNQNKTNDDNIDKKEDKGQISSLMELNSYLKALLCQAVVDLTNTRFAHNNNKLPPPPIDINFMIPAMPAKGELEKTSICVFLYSVQEDMDLRTSLIPHYSGSTLLESFVKCDYLITIFGALADEQEKSDSQVMRLMNGILQSLLLDRLTHKSPSISSAKIITPMELNSLGNFWQSLGNKPRLCLNYSATIPLALKANVNTNVDIVDAFDISIKASSKVSDEDPDEKYVLESEKLSHQKL